jgi:hypothetical protein
MSIIIFVLLFVYHNSIHTHILIIISVLLYFITILLSKFSKMSQINEDADLLAWGLQNIIELGDGSIGGTLLAAESLLELSAEEVDASTTTPPFPDLQASAAAVAVAPVPTNAAVARTPNNTVAVVRPSIPLGIDDAILPSTWHTMGEVGILIPTERVSFTEAQLVQYAGVDGCKKWEAARELAYEPLTAEEKRVRGLSDPFLHDYYDNMLGDIPRLCDTTMEQRKLGLGVQEQGPGYYQLVAFELKHTETLKWVVNSFFIADCNILIYIFFFPILLFFMMI